MSSFGHDYGDKVAASFVDHPVKLRGFRYVKRPPVPAKPHKTTAERMPTVIADRHDPCR